MVAYSSGFWLGLSLIVAIGAQNAFVLRQGLLGQHVLPVVLVCVVSDALLISLGVFGFDVILKHYPMVEVWARFGGAVFLCLYALLCFYRAWQMQGGLQPVDALNASLRQVLWICVLLTWLNPHVYLDTVVLLGAISTQFAGMKLEFALGAISASIVLFFSLGYGARILRPWFANPKTWQGLEIAVGILMLTIAVRLLKGDV